MELTLEQVEEMAPDASSVAAGKKLMALKNWPELGRSENALWGKCQGSKVYQVRVDRSNLGYHCNCPSRKFPCKHVLGLLMLTAASPDAVSAADNPDWVDEWLAKRRDRDEKKTAAKSDAPRKPLDERAQKRRAEKRESRVRDGLERLDLWLKDIIRSGLAGVEAKSPSFWDEQAKRLVDAQAPGLASRISRLAAIPGSSRDWPGRLLSELGRTKLLLQAWRRIDHLDADLQCDVRQLIGWNVAQDEIENDGKKVTDTWIVFGQWVDDDDDCIRAQRSWVVGRETGRTALLLQFAARGQPFGEPIVAGSEQKAMLAFYPGASKQRAKVLNREGNVAAVESRIPGHASIDQFLASVGDSLARQPWLSAFGCVLHDVTLVPDEETWHVRDDAGSALPLGGRDHWKLLAVTGGHPVDLTGEWDGDRLRPLGLFFDNHFRVA